MQKSSVLIIDDCFATQKGLQKYFSAKGYKIFWATSTTVAWRRLVQQQIDLVLLSYILAGQDMLSFLRQLRVHPNCFRLPVLMLIPADESLADDSFGLAFGADDFLIRKPGFLNELPARIERTYAQRYLLEKRHHVLCYRGLKLDPNTHQVTVNGALLPLSLTQFRLLQFFLLHPGHLFSRAELLQQLWEGRKVIERNIDTQMRHLRQLLEPSGHHTFFETIYGLGYRLAPLDDE